MVVKRGLNHDLVYRGSHHGHYWRGIIGTSASILLLTTGRVAGISGILGGLLKASQESKQWRVLFLFGLFFAGSLGAAFLPEQIQIPQNHSLMALGVAGLLVGFGTRLGNGCTSGHGICGLSRSQALFDCGYGFYGNGFYHRNKHSTLQWGSNLMIALFAFFSGALFGLGL